MTIPLELPFATILLRLAVATLLGALIGLERERLERAAGLRTHALVALASALIMIVSAYSFADLGPTTRDPARMAAQVVSGIGFLGAGVIIFRKNTVRGLTTAASIWAVSGLGLAAGGGLLHVAAVGTGFILLIQVGLRPFEQRFFAHRQEHHLISRVERGARRLAAVERATGATAIEVRGLRLRPVRGGREDRVELDLGATHPGAIAELLEALRAVQGVRVVTYMSGVARARRPAHDRASEREGGEPLDDLLEEDGGEDS